MIGVGSQLGPYEVVAEIAQGGMARLFLGQRRGPGGFSRRVAIKVIHPEWAADHEVLHMFLDEARLSACIHHPNVVHVEELGEQGGIPYLVMEHIDGVTLADVIRGFLASRRWMPVELAVALGARIADGLHAAHESTDESGRLLNVIHRDVSPQNVLIDALGHVKVIDFGVAKARDRLVRTNTGSIKGKLAYMSPEQLRGEAVDRRCDVFSLGIVIWELLAMRRLFHRSNDLDTVLAIRDGEIERPSKFRPDLPPHLDDIVMTALARPLEERFATAAAVRRAMLIAVRDAALVEASAIGDLVRDIAADALERRRAATKRDESTAPARPITRR